jgi:phenylalanyl-tRNA synthetase beta chain
MKISYNWIKEFVDIDAPAADVASALTMSGIEVEGLEHSTIPEEIISAKIIEVMPHPNADKLSICMVDAGSGEPIKVVCGAPNVRTGLVSAYAPEGATIGDFKVKKAKIRGEESFGILLSEKELGLTDDHTGIMEIDDELKPGLSLFKSNNLEDWLFDINVTPNRGDCLSVLGIARELSAIYKNELRLPVFTINEDIEPVEKYLNVEIIAKDGCPRYCARQIRDVKIRKSPFWMRRRLFQSGVRAINNIVDITNLVMIEYGQPLHAFDYRFLDGQGIIVRRAQSGERFITLDSVERILTDDDLLICDNSKPVALAGIMGGENSEVKDDTTDVTLESAFFDPINIRRTSRKSGLSTEASYRFERGIDPEIQAMAANRASWLMQELGDGKVAKGIIDKNYSTLSGRVIQLRRKYLERVLGISNFSNGEIEEIFLRLGCKIEGSGDVWKVIVPALRHDLEHEIDLVEEFIRIYGMDRVRPELPLYRPDGEVYGDSLTRSTRVRLASMGLNEIITYSFISPIWKKFFLEAMLQLKNPLSEDMSLMRISLIPGLVGAAARNKNLQNKDINIFEIGRCFLPKTGQKLPQEKEMLGIAISGTRRDQHFSEQKKSVDFYDIKGLAEALIPDLSLMQSEHAFFKAGMQADIFSAGNTVGCLGAVSEEILQAMDISEDVFVLEMEFAALSSKKWTGITSVPKFPATWRDLSLVADEDVEYAKIEQIMDGLKIRELKKVTPIDTYSGDKLPSGKKGITVRVTYQSLEKTLDDKQINKWQDMIIQALQKDLGITLR